MVGVTRGIFVGISRKGDFSEPVTLKREPSKSGLCPAVQPWRKSSKQQGNIPPRCWGGRTPNNIAQWLAGVKSYKQSEWGREDDNREVERGVIQDWLLKARALTFSLRHQKLPEGSDWEVTSYDLFLIRVTLAALLKHRRARVEAKYRWLKLWQAQHRQDSP